MACTYGRPQLSDDEDRKLFAESAGTCLLCNTSLFPDDPTRTRSIPIAERAHIIAHSDDGPRSDATVPVSDRSAPANLVLLCPTCHTKADKAPDAYPTDLLRRMKDSRRQAVERIGGTPLLRDRADARRAALSLLNRNRLLFRRYGPSPDDGGTGSIEAAELWTERVLSEIVPNNKLLVALVEVNRNLATPEDLATAELLRQHTDDLERKHAGTSAVVGPAARFPASADKLFE